MFKWLEQLFESIKNAFIKFWEGLFKFSKNEKNEIEERIQNIEKILKEKGIN